MERQSTRIQDQQHRARIPRRRLSARVLAGALCGVALGFGLSASARAGKVDCDALLTPAEIAKACGEKSVARAKPPEAGDVLDVGICLRRFSDKHGRTVDLTVSSAGDDEIHAEAEETLREHGGDAEYATIGTSPVLGAIWSTRAAPERGAHADVFTGPWRMTLFSEAGRKGALCSPRALGDLADRSVRRLPAQPEPAATPKKPKR